MSDDRMTDKRLNDMVNDSSILGNLAFSVEEGESALRELQAARQEIASRPPRMSEAVIRPVYPISEEDDE